MNKSIVGIVILLGVVVCGWAILGYAQDQGRIAVSEDAKSTAIDSNDDIIEYVPSTAPSGVCGGAEGGCVGNCGGEGCGGMDTAEKQGGGGCGCGG